MRAASAWALVLASVLGAASAHKATPSPTPAPTPPFKCPTTAISAPWTSAPLSDQGFDIHLILVEDENNETNPPGNFGDVVVLRNPITENGLPWGYLQGSCTFTVAFDPTTGTGELECAGTFVHLDSQGNIIGTITLEGPLIIGCNSNTFDIEGGAGLFVGANGFGVRTSLGTGPQGEPMQHWDLIFDIIHT